MAEFQKVMKEYNRLCRSYTECSDGCPLRHEYASCKDELIDHPDEAEKIIMEWTSKHPVVTNGRMFEKIFGISGRDIVAINKLAWLEEEYKGGDDNG